MRVESKEVVEGKEWDRIKMYELSKIIKSILKIKIQDEDSLCF